MEQDPAIIGARIAEFRRARGMSQQVAADLAGIDRSYWSLLESGKRALLRRSTALAVANALQITPDQIFGIGENPWPYDSPTEASVGAIREALVAADVGDPGGQVQPVEQLRVRVETGLTAAQQVRLPEVGAMLPDLIRDLYTTLATGRDTAELLRLSTLTGIKVAESYLVGVHAPPDLVWLAIRMGRDAAERLGEPDSLGLAAFGASNGLLGRGMFALAEQSLDAVPEPDHLELRGAITLTRTLLAAAQKRDSDVPAGLAEASAMAERTGDGNAFWLSFGPSNVRVWQVSVAVEQGEFGQAAAIWDTVNMRALPKGRQVTALLAGARAMSQLPDRRHEAVLALHRAEALSPPAVQRAPGARALLAELLSRVRDDAIGAELRGMANRAGLAV